LSNSVFGVIGLGSISDRHRKNLRFLFPESDIACLSSSGRILSHLPENCDILVDSLEQLINLNPKFIIIASPSTYHAAHAIPLIQNKIPLLIEKPIAASLEDSILIEEAALRHNTPVAVAYCLRYKPFIQNIKEVLEQEEIGKILNVEIYSGSYLPDWRPNKNYLESASASSKLGGGALLELSHEIDYALWILGDLNLESAELINSKILDIDVEDTVNLILTLKNSACCNIHLNFIQKFSQRYAYFYGSKGKIFWDLLTNNIKIISNGKEKIFELNVWDPNEMYIEMLKDFYNNFMELKSNNLPTLKDAGATLSIIHQAQQIQLKANNA